MRWILTDIGADSQTFVAMSRQMQHVDLEGPMVAAQMGPVDGELLSPSGPAPKFEFKRQTS